MPQDANVERLLTFRRGSGNGFDGLIDNARLGAHARRQFIETPWLQDDKTVGQLQGVFRTPVRPNVAVEIGPRQGDNQGSAGIAEPIAVDRLDTFARVQGHEQVAGPKVVAPVDLDLMAELPENARP